MQQKQYGIMDGKINFPHFPLSIFIFIAMFSKCVIMLDLQENLSFHDEIGKLNAIFQQNPSQMNLEQIHKIRHLLFIAQAFCNPP